MRMHDAEMYLVSVSHRGSGHGEDVAMICITDDLLVALNTARTVEKFGFSISSIDDGAFIWSMNVGHLDTRRTPIFERRWNRRKEIWAEHWNSSPHRNLVGKLA